MATDNIFFIDHEGQVFSGSMRKKFPPISTGIPPMHLSGWVASEGFNFLEANAPVYRKSAILKTMPYMIEEYLLEPLDNYHFTIIMSGRTKPVSIYATTQAKMEEWLQMLDSINLVPEGLYPDILALANESGYIHAYIGAKRSLARTGEYTGFCGKGELFFSLLEAEAEKQNKQLRITTEKISLVPTKFKKYVIAKDIEWLGLLSEAPLPANDCNLLHSKYTSGESSKDDGFKFTPLKTMAVAASFLLLLLIADFTKMMTYKNQTTEIHARSKELYEQMFKQEITDITQLRNRVLINLQDTVVSPALSESDTWVKLNELSDLLSICSICNLLEFKLLPDSKRVSLTFESRQENSEMANVFSERGWRTLSWKTKELDTPKGFYKVFLHRAIVEKSPS